MIMGPQEHLRAIGMRPDADVDALRATIEAAAADVGTPDAVLILADLMGGSPANACAYLALAGTPVVCGMNLPMLLEVLAAREQSSAAELAAVALHSGRVSILNLAQTLTSG